MPVPDCFRLHRLATAALCVFGCGLAVAASQPAARFSVADAAAPANRGQVTFVVTRSGNVVVPSSVDFATQDGTAKAGVDYVAGRGTLSFAVGQSSATVSVKLLKSSVPAARSFTLELSEAAATPTSAGTFATGKTVDVDPFLVGAAVADFNGDGKPDVAVYSDSQGDFGIPEGNLHFLRNDTPKRGTSTTFVDAAVFQTESLVAVPETADLNRDGKPDVVLPGDAVYMNTTPPGGSAMTFQVTPLPILPSGGTRSATFADFDGDGIVDLALSSTAGQAAVLRNLTPVGALTPTFAPPIAFQADSLAYDIVALDVNGDGKPDLAVGNRGNPDVSILLNTTAPGGPISFSGPFDVVVADNVQNLATADLNGDGKPDLVTANPGLLQTGTAWSALLNTTPEGATKPTFALTVTFGGAPFDVSLADADRDGTPDVFIANAQGSIDVFLNRTPVGATVAVFEPSASVGAGNSPEFVVTGDWNRDGAADFMTGDSFLRPDRSARFFLGVPAIARPKAKIVDADATGTIEPN